MGSITVRNLDEQLKRRLRVRAAEHDRSEYQRFQRLRHQRDRSMALDAKRFDALGQCAANQ